MTFTTLTFVVFLLLTFTSYWKLGKRSLQNIFLVVISYIFYGWWDYRFCFLLLASSSVDYWIGLYLARADSDRKRKLLLFSSLCINLGLLGFFKYWNFFSQSLVDSLSLVGWKLDYVALNVILPVGISFYTFQTLSYTIDIYRRQLQPTQNYIDYLAYVSFFPQLVAGPIERAPHLLPQFLHSRQFNYELAVDGCRQILWGLAKKMLVADNLAAIVDSAFGQPSEYPGPQLVFATIAFAFQIYCDFSAYSDIAIGTARLFGFDLMRNFAYPYFSQSMAEFWRRWHISFSSWLRDYVYIPLGGSRVTSLRRIVNVMLTFLISGLWHGAAWNFVIWGGIHGGVVLVEKLWIPDQTLKATDTPCGEGLFPKLGILIRVLITFSLTCLSWIFFRAKTIQDAGFMVQKIFVDALRPAAYKSFGTIVADCPIGKWIVVVLACLVLIEWLQRRYAHPLVLKKLPQSIRWSAYTLLLWITLAYGTWSTGQFVYFQF